MKGNKYLIFTGMGMELVGLIITATWGGNWIDKNYGFSGVFMISFSMAALIGWLVHIIQIAKALEKNQDQ